MLVPFPVVQGGIDCGSIHRPCSWLHTVRRDAFPGALIVFKILYLAMPDSYSAFCLAISLLRAARWCREGLLASPQGRQHCPAIPWDLSCLSDPTKHVLELSWFPGSLLARQGLSGILRVFLNRGSSGRACELPSLLSPGSPALAPTRCPFCSREDFVCALLWPQVLRVFFLPTAIWSFSSPWKGSILPELRSYFSLQLCFLCTAG